VRSITQDDAHIFCNMAGLEAALLETWEIINLFYGAFSLPLKLRVSLRDKNQPKKYLGKPKLWNAAEAIIKDASKKIKIPQYTAKGEAAFYGPKLDFMATDSLGREWQVATIQIDMVMPERFILKFVNDKGNLSDIVIVHCAIMGSIERFLAILIEHYAGVFPLWLSPVQVAIIPISEKHESQSHKVKLELEKNNIRAELKNENETMGKRLREAEMQKTPYILIIGDKEIQSGSVSVRQRSKGEIGQMKLDKFIEKIKEEIKNKK
ncbi:MAG: threonine--tRNA ligase, partial [Candidatus Staskawiczbacteria bacterium]|nr:threonine--tRNA ligase [Candidatus Staskawiczbacteria bacterium]